MSPASGQRRALAHDDRRRLQFGARGEMLHLVVVVRHRRASRRCVVDRILVCDHEVEGERHGLGVGPDGPAHRHRLAGEKRLGRHPAGAVALGVAAQLARVRARLRAADADVRERAHRRAQEADLRLRRGVIGARQRRDRERRSGKHRRGVERRRRAAANAGCAVGGLLGGDAPGGQRERGRAREHDQHRATEQEAAHSRHRCKTVHRSSYVGCRTREGRNAMGWIRR